MTDTTKSPPTTFSQLWEELKTEALNLWQSVKNDVVNIEHQIVPVVEQDVVLILSQFKSVALNTALALGQQAFSNLTGAQKNEITVNSIVNAAKAAGQTIVQQDAQLLAQQAYQGLASAVGTLESK